MRLSVNGKDGQFEESAVVQNGDEGVVEYAQRVDGRGVDGETILFVTLPAANAVLNP